jgi:hypothetical protein
MKFLISEEEKSRILEMHQNATSRQYLTEAPVDTKYTEGLIQNIMNQIASIINTKIDEAIKTHPNEPWSPSKVTVDKGISDGNSFYFFKYGGKRINDDYSINTIIDEKMKDATTFLNSIKTQFDVRYYPELNSLSKYFRAPKFNMPLKQIHMAVDKWFADIQPQLAPASPAAAKPVVKKA